MRTGQFLLLAGMTAFLCTACAGPAEIHVSGVLSTGETDLITAVPEPRLTEAGFGQTDGWESLRTEKDADGSAQSESPAGSDIMVYVCGAVREPAVYALSPDSRICDAIDAAGGFSEDADTQWLNQAQKLYDGQMLVVYTSEETARLEQDGITRGSALPGTYTADTSAASSEDAVNLNTASRDQLMTLPGIGASKADSIIRYREETGPFASPEDVMNISGIKESVYSKIKDRITV